MSPLPLEDARAVGPMRFVLTTYPSREAAFDAVGSVLSDKLAACANVVTVTSRYWWKGEVESADEALVIFKTVPKRVGALFHYLETTHPYEVPEVVEVDVPRVGARYLGYLLDTLEPGGSRPPSPGQPTRRGGRRGRGARSPARTRAPRRRRSR